MHWNLSTEKDCGWSNITEVCPSATIPGVLRNICTSQGTLEPVVVTFEQENTACIARKELGWLRFAHRYGWSLWDSSQPGYSFPWDTEILNAGEQCWVVGEWEMLAGCGGNTWEHSDIADHSLYAICHPPLLLPLGVILKSRFLLWDLTITSKEIGKVQEKWWTEGSYEHH